MCAGEEETENVAYAQHIPRVVCAVAVGDCKHDCRE
jgi:hypothetical protein